MSWTGWKELASLGVRAIVGARVHLLRWVGLVEVVDLPKMYKISNKKPGDMGAGGAAVNDVIRFSGILA